ncbi:hypothetical protein D3C85_1397880 [compost metagenome]
MPLLAPVIRMTFDWVEEIAILLTPIVGSVLAAPVRVCYGDDAVPVAACNEAKGVRRPVNEW